MATSFYCPFFCVILLPDRFLNDDPLSPQTRVRLWYAEVRGIYSTNTNTTAGDISITGLGIICMRKDLHAPLDRDLSYVDVSFGALERWWLCEPSSSESRWCFGFHDSCWRLLLLLRLGHRQDDDLLPE